ncbi:hypothetical protein ASF69_11010 [Rhizobium sp. Leaf311]|nr:hypothetical protein ASF69_11010 [Rhizobium sp. Leaf311]
MAHKVSIATAIADAGKKGSEVVVDRIRRTQRLFWHMPYIETRRLLVVVIAALQQIFLDLFSC